MATDWGSGGGSVGRAVASNSRGPRFESSNRQKITLNIYCQLYWKDENKEKESGMAHFNKKKWENEKKSLATDGNSHMVFTTYRLTRWIKYTFDLETILTGSKKVKPRYSQGLRGIS